MEKRIVIAIRITKEEYDAIEREVRSRKLTEKQRRWLNVLRLRFIGYSNTEIAELTGYSKSNVVQLLRRFKSQGLERFLR